MIPKYTENCPLHYAVQLGELERVRELLGSGTKVDCRDKHGITPLMIAARNDLKDIARELLEAGANINAKDRASRNWIGKRTPLLHACQTGRFQMMRFLIERGADPECLDQHRRIPLSYVLSGGHREIALYLLDHGASAIGPENCFDPPIVAAARKNDAAMVKELLARGANANVLGALGNPPLADTTSVECAKELLAHGADVELKNAQGKTPLMVNIVCGSKELLQCYIEAGADVNAADKDGCTVLMSLTDRPRIDVAEVLISAGAEINALPRKNLSVLDYFYGIAPDNHTNDRVNLIAFLERKGAKRAIDLKTSNRD